MLLRDLVSLGLQEGDLVCVHSSLKGFGHLVGGAMTVISAINEVIGPQGTLVMPTFNGGQSTFAYVSSNPEPFDPESTPATTGQLPNLFRQLPNTLRSLHPTHSVAASGPLADRITESHHLSTTPFGDETPYARLVTLKAKVLLLNTNGNSILHRLQEMVDWPNLFVQGDCELPLRVNGTIQRCSTRVHSPGPFSHVLLPAQESEDFRLLLLPDYAYAYNPNGRTQSVLNSLHPEVASWYYERCSQFRHQKVVQEGPAGHGRAALIRTQPFVSVIRNDLEEHLLQHRWMYTPKRLKALCQKQDEAFKRAGFA
ncbi:MAG: AAC(3) family N-acetyltransferase [Desulfohalobiaceae bacterium]|nr:AAC(3) family N-acetyltransferase [Desulfohalobiaceae bacterium]